MSGHTADVAKTLQDVNDQITQCLQSLKSLGLALYKTLHHDKELPDRENVNLAAQAVDSLHQIQLMLDPPTLILADHFLGYVRSKCLVAAVQRGVPDALAQRPMTLAELAKKTDSKPERLAQILRPLCLEGIFSYDEESHQFSNNPASTLLLSSHWTQWHNWVTLYGNQFFDIARGIPEAMTTGTSRSAAQINFDTDSNMFEFFRKQDWAPQLHRTLGGGATAQLPGILADYPWDEVADGLVMDIGGGAGDFLAGLLRKHSSMQGGLFDQPYIVDYFRQTLAEGGRFHDIAARVRDDNIIGGDFFQAVPRCEVYTMKWCLHDWTDEKAEIILKVIRENMSVVPKSRLVVLESVLSDQYSERLAIYGDINMMMTINGGERNRDDWERLARSSGWRIEGIWNLRRAWVKAIDLRPLSD
ncbi:S-adenosyl-L-methionine-dependent methyltransferase [Xylariaceae sp. FL0255]|nr:S-adenosyl-L-methionine-dependent methyltransferase [Xylariaceae sp. FL0255]